MDMQKVAELRKKANTLPMEPGVYLMRDRRGEIIYVGKAKKLKNRVTSYFRGVERHLPKVYRMVEMVQDFDYIVTDSEFEALVLECSLIKLHSPKYNILLKDDKGYHGYGVKSMQMIAKKYGGDIRISVQNHTFSLQIMLPVE